MNKSIFLTFAALPLILTSCATPQREAFHNPDSTALVIASLDNRTCEMIQPTATAPSENNKVLAQAVSFPQHLTAVVILENYTEAQLGDQFRARGAPLFIGLRGLGYQHIFFLQGKGVSNPEGLPTLVEYD
jgi:hypothetical protein